MTTWNADDAVQAIMDRFAKTCIRIHRPFPPPRIRHGRSKLGGLPNLPPDIEWPCGHEHFGLKRGRIPLHFMAQIDCSELPRGQTGLPASGLLYVFANIDDAADWMEHDPDDYRRVIYAPRVAPDQPVRQPPPDLPQIGTASLLGTCYLGGAYPLGYRVGHFPNDPLTGKLFFEWPAQFVMTDSYPDVEAIRKTPAWVAMSSDAAARTAAIKAAGGSDWYDDGTLADMYQDGKSDRMFRNLYAALKLPEIASFPQSERTPKKWRRFDDEMRGSFPPIAGIASEIAVAIDNLCRERIALAEGTPRGTARPGLRTPSDDGTLFGQLSGRIRKMFGSGTPAADQRSAPIRTPPGWTTDLKLVRQEATDWLRQLLVLPIDHPLDAASRTRFLAWLDDLEDRNWARIDGHQPQMERVEYAFDQAMFQILRLAASNQQLRAHVPDELYRWYSSAIYQDSPCHQMLGHFKSSQQPRPLSDPMVPLLMLSYDKSPDFRICDVGELQFFINERDLKARNFASVEAQMQGG
jgi:uncharacterized protein YwqG